MTIYLGLGSNEGDRKRNIEKAIEELISAGFRLDRISPMVESPAMLPDQADPAWHKPFLNLAICGESDWQPNECLEVAKRIEIQLGREQNGLRWAPRPIDIDLLYWHGESTQSGELAIPHPGIAKRDFVLTPLLHLQPDLTVGENNQSVFNLTRQIRPIPLWMAIINVTPDSFSDGGSWADESELDRYLDKLIEQNVQIIDVGAESTRPRGETLHPDDEWKRLLPVLARLKEKLLDRRVKPWISLDSRNPVTIERAMSYGLDVVNDVTGLHDPDMIALVKQSGLQAIAMHSLSVPVDPSLQMPNNRSALVQMREWSESKLEQWVKTGIDLNRVILDPGIGFGKSNIQAFELLSHCAELREAGLRLLVGHSRKSFMNGFTDRPTGLRDLETLGMSISLCHQGVDILRVHSPFIHMRAYRAWSHVN